MWGTSFYNAYRTECVMEPLISSLLVRTLINLVLKTDTLKEHLQLKCASFLFLCSHCCHTAFPHKQAISVLSYEYGTEVQ